MPAAFDYIAPFYDALALLVFGKNLVNAKKKFLHYIPDSGRLLLIGGGTGNILNHLLEMHSGLIIDFIEASPKMLRVAQKNLDPQFAGRVHFISGTHHQILRGIEYDAVTSFFVIDCMRQQEAFEFAKAITLPLKKDGIWLFADFFPVKNIFYQSLLWLMYRFFHLVAGVRANKLPDYDSIFQQLKFREVTHELFLDGFIKSIVYHRSMEKQD